MKHDAEMHAYRIAYLYLCWVNTCTYYSPTSTLRCLDPFSFSTLMWPVYDLLGFAGIALLVCFLWEILKIGQFSHNMQYRRTLKSTNTKKNYWRFSGKLVLSMTKRTFSTKLWFWEGTPPLHDVLLLHHRSRFAVCEQPPQSVSFSKRMGPMGWWAM